MGDLLRAPWRGEGVAVSALGWSCSRELELEALLQAALASLEEGGDPLDAFMAADRAARLYPDQSAIQRLRLHCLAAAGAKPFAFVTLLGLLHRFPADLPAIRALLLEKDCLVDLPHEFLTRQIERLIEWSDLDEDRILAASCARHLGWDGVGQCELSPDRREIHGWFCTSSAADVMLSLEEAGRVLGQLHLPMRPLVDDSAMFRVRRFVCAFPEGVRSLVVRYQGRALYGTPLLQPVRPSDGVLIPLEEETGGAGRVDIIIPVYRNMSLTQRCIESVLASETSLSYDLVVVDDASPEPELSAWLERLASVGKITLLRNSQNLGFILSVNRALSLHPSRDVLLLNADTEVAGDWLDRLHACAYRQPDVGTVTPLSNNGEHFSFPVPMTVSCMPSTVRLAQLQLAASRSNDQLSIEVPFGIGFCLYVRRDCLENIGYLDDDGLRRGYGEEVDLCLRGSQAGWKNVCALDVFVAHQGNVSFGAEKTILVEKNNRLIRQRHPQARDLYRNFIRRDPLKPFRAAIERELLRSSGNDHVLVVIDAFKPTDKRWRSHWVERAQDSTHHLYLAPDASSPGEYCLYSDHAAGPKNLFYRLPQDYSLLCNDLSDLRISRIEYLDLAAQHELLLNLPTDLAVPYELWAADYTLYCPRRFLVTKGSYCGEPLDPRVCERCVEEEGSLLVWYRNYADYQSQIQRLIGGCSAIKASSHAADSRLRHRLGKPIVLERLQPVTYPQLLDNGFDARSDDPLTVAIVGPLFVPDGYHRLLDLARHAAEACLPISFVVLGHTLNDYALMATGKVWVTGPVSPEESLADLAQLLRAHAVLYLPPWPEAELRQWFACLETRLPLMYWPYCETSAPPEPARVCRELPYQLTPETLLNTLSTMI